MSLYAAVQVPRILDFSRLDAAGEYDCQAGVCVDHIVATAACREYFHAIVPTLERDGSHYGGAVMTLLHGHYLPFRKSPR